MLLWSEGVGYCPEAMPILNELHSESDSEKACFSALGRSQPLFIRYSTFLGSAATVYRLRATAFDQHWWDLVTEA
jgi:hypothetical protein